MNTNMLIGFGSEILSDQAIIPDLISSVSREYSEMIDFKCELISSLDLVGLFEPYDKLLILDTIQNPNMEVGSLQYYSLADYKPSLHLENYHDSSFVESIEIANQLGIAIPEKIGIVTINTKEVYTLSTSYCPELDMNYTELLHQLKILINHFFQLYTLKKSIVE